MTGTIFSSPGLFNFPDHRLNRIMSPTKRKKEIKGPGQPGRSRYVFPRIDAEVLDKHGVRMYVHSGAGDCRLASAVYQETSTGHLEEFFHETSAFIYYIIERAGIFVIEGSEYPVRATDVVIIPPKKRFWFRGSLKQILVTAPAWREEEEHHIRDVDLASDVD